MAREDPLRLNLLISWASGLRPRTNRIYHFLRIASHRLDLRLGATDFFIKCEPVGRSLTQISFGSLVSAVSKVSTVLTVSDFVSFIVPS